MGSSKVTFYATALTALFAAATSHPQCLDFTFPFDPEAELVMCTEYQTFSCCDGGMEADLIDKYYNLTIAMTPEEQIDCGVFLMNLICQKCSPFAAHIYNAEDGPEASFPGLCGAYCNDMLSQCPSIVKLLTNDPELNGFVQNKNYAGFCNAVTTPDPDYCYPDLKYNPVLTENLGTVSYYQTTSSCVPMCLLEVANRRANPLSAKHANDGTQRLFISEQIAVVWIYMPDQSRISVPFLDLREVVLVNKRYYDERGLLDLAFHPNYKTNGRFFLYYSQKINEREYVKISEMKVSDNDMNKANMTSERTLLEILQPASNHNGGQLLFGLDGYLYIFTGDGGGAGDPFGAMGNGQNKKTLLGKVLRIDVNSVGNAARSYGIPPDNPFVNDPAYLPEIYALGVRNMWRCSMDRGNKTSNGGRIFCGDVGQDRYEEIDIIQKGGNYGWRGYEGYSCFDKNLCNGRIIENYVRPIHAYDHSLGKSVTGGYVYRGCENPNLQGKYIFGDYMSGSIWALSEAANGSWTKETICMASDSVCKNGGLTNTYGHHILSFGEDEGGELYLLASIKSKPGNPTGSVYKLVDPSRRGDPSTCRTDVTEVALQNGAKYIPYADANVKLRLVSLNGSPTEGRVEVLFDGEWGTICDDSWDLKDAHVACRMLGFSHAISAPRRAIFGRGRGRIWLDDMKCTGREMNIGQCPSSPWGIHDCSHREDASVQCRPLS